MGLYLTRRLIMKKIVFLFCTVALLGLNACDESENDQTNTPPDDGASKACEDTCKGNDICDGTDAYKTCKDKDGDGCREWVSVPCDDDTKCDKGKCVSDQKDKCDGGKCPPEDKDKCEGDNCPPEDKDKCQNTCEGADICDGTDAYKTCRDNNGDGCNEWVVVPCEENQKCDKGKCIAEENPQCEGDNCPPEDKDKCQNACEGDNYCDGTSAFKTCRDDDNDGCKEWVTVPCGENQKCDKGECVGACESKCEKGKKQCSDKSVQTCDDYNQDGCFEWGGDSPCDYKCSDGSCVDDPNAIPACSGDDCPEVVTDFSKKISGNTQGGTTKFGTYSCASDKSEGGPERAYVFKVDEPGTIIAGVTEPSGGDVDVHILSALDANSCLARGDIGANAHVDAGIYYVVVDTFGDSGKAGSYNLKITFLPDSGKCGLVPTKITHKKVGEMQLPITGRVVKEAHMMTDHDWSLHGRWPTSFTEFLAEHRAYSAKWTGINDGNEWCPKDEGGCQYGQGATSNPVPWKAEAWYVCMYWVNGTKPEPGTRFLVVNPQTGKTVVTAAGYETGPGDANTIGGAVYEIHYTLGTDHMSTLTYGQMKDQSLEYGPIDCTK